MATLTKEQFPAFLKVWHSRRHRARTDLLYLCNEVLGYKDVSMEVHGPIIEALQRFQGVIEGHKTQADYLEALMGNKALFTPICPFTALEPCGFRGKRKNLILFPRGHLKSTVATIAHTIQWIINYPNIRVLITTATQDLGQEFLREIKKHMLTNEVFRFLFPEFCPSKEKMEMGNSERFTVLCRDDARKELGQGGAQPSVLVSTVGSSITGYHGDVQKNDDLVEKENSKTPGGIQDVIYHFGTMDPLLETYENPKNPEEPFKGWIDMSGTPWDFSDLYAMIQNGEEKLPEERRTWSVVKRSAAPNWPSGPFLWPQRLGYSGLKEIEDDPARGPGLLSSQYLMKPIVAGQGLIESDSQISWIPRDRLKMLLPQLSLYAALDLAGMDADARGTDNDYSALSVGGFDGDGRMYLVDVWHGRPDQFTVIEWLFQVFEKYPMLIKCKMEKEAHARTILPFLKREMMKRKKWLTIDAQPRNTRESKQNKIKGLQPWFASGAIRFADDLGCRTALVQEIMGFPKFRHDDILDTIVDIMHEAKGVVGAIGGREKPEIEARQNELQAMELKPEFLYPDHRDDWESGVDAYTGW